jgi:hypothetical protein
VLSRLPVLCGRRIRVGWRSSLRAHRGRLRSGQGAGMEVHAASFIRQRRLVLDRALLESPPELARIVVHELFHFIWVRLSNAQRASWERVLVGEQGRRARGELGWSAEWRKEALTAADCAQRSRRWREYACESFCDTAAWRFAGLDRHAEYTLKPAFRGARGAWFEELSRHQKGGWRI